MMKQGWIAPSASVSVVCGDRRNEARILSQLDHGFDSCCFFSIQVSMSESLLAPRSRVISSSIRKLPRHGFADRGVDLAEVTEIGGEAVADLADHRHPRRSSGTATRAWCGRRRCEVCPAGHTSSAAIAAADGHAHRSLVEKILNSHGRSLVTRWKSLKQPPVVCRLGGSSSAIRDLGCTWVDSDFL